MADDAPSPDDAAQAGGDADRTATVRTEHADAATVAAALGPDETDSMRTRVDGDVVACSVARPTTGGLQSTLDDHLVNLRVADRLIERGQAHVAADASPTAAANEPHAGPSTEPHADSTAEQHADSTDEPQPTDTDTQTDT